MYIRDKALDGTCRYDRFARLKLLATVRRCCSSAALANVSLSGGLPTLTIHQFAVALGLHDGMSLLSLWIVSVLALHASNHDMLDRIHSQDTTSITQTTTMHRCTLLADATHGHAMCTGRVLASTDVSRVTVPTYVCYPVHCAFHPPASCIVTALGSTDFLF